MDLHNALRLDDPGRLAIYRRTAELVAPIAERAVDCLIGKAAAAAPHEGAVPATARSMMIKMYAGVAAQFTLAMSDLASLERDLAERSRTDDETLAALRERRRESGARLAKNPRPAPTASEHAPETIGAGI
jgi:hypothetical protein